MNLSISVPSDEYCIDESNVCPTWDSHKKASELFGDMQNVQELGASPLPSAPIELAPKIFITDLDECIVQVGSLCIAKYAWMHINKQEMPVSIAAPFALNNGIFRPGMTTLLNEVMKMRKNGELDECVLYTRASNANGWVDYVIRCIEYVLNIERGGIFDRVISIDSPIENFIVDDGHEYKHLKFVSYDHRKCFMIDDKIVKEGYGKAIQTSIYNPHINILNLYRQMPNWDLEFERYITSDLNQADIDKNIFNIPINKEIQNHPVCLGLFNITRDAQMYPPNLSYNWREDNGIINVLKDLKEFLRERNSTH